MNEQQLSALTQEHKRSHTPEVALIAESALSLESHSAYPAPSRETPDWRRLDVAANRFGDRLTEGLTRTEENGTGIDDDTARMIAHVLGRALGRESALASYARTGTGYYPELRDEYLDLYHHTDTGWVQDLVDKYGSHLIRERYPDAQRIQYVSGEHRELERLLVPTSFEIGNRTITAHVPGVYGCEAIRELSQTLTELHADDDNALRAFLSLPDVNAMSGNIMEDFHSQFIGTYPSLEDAIHELSGVEDRIEEVHEYAAERQLIIDNVSPDYEALAETMEAGFDIVEDDTGKRRTYAFYK